MPVQHLQLRPKKEPVLARRLGGPAISGGPTYRPPSGMATKALAKPYFRPGAGSLEEALRAAQPVTGKAVDTQAVAWAKRKEIVAEEQAKIEKEADALYGVVQGLEKQDQDYILDKIVKKKGAGGLATALDAKPGAISPAAVGTDPLKQTMVDKNYIRLDASGEYSWMLPMKEKAVSEINTWTDESGWLQQTTTYKDGTTETEILGRAAKEEVTAGLTSSEQLGWAKLNFDVDKAGAIHVAAALKAQGPAPIEGVTTMKREKGYKDRIATADDVAAYYQAIKTDADYRRVAAEGIKTEEDLRIKYQYDTEAIKNFQRNIPGMVVDGKWSDVLEQSLSALLIGGE